MPAGRVDELECCTPPPACPQSCDRQSFVCDGVHQADPAAPQVPEPKKARKGKARRPEAGSEPDSLPNGEPRLILRPQQLALRL